MPKQPTSEDLGGVPRIDGARPVGSYDVDAYARGAQKIVQAGEHLGASVTRLGEADAAFATRRARAELNAATTQAITGIFKTRAPSADPASPADPQQHAENVAGLIYDAAEGIKSGPAQMAYFAAMRPVYAQEVRNAELQRSHDDANAQATHLEQLMSQLEENPSTHDALTAAAIDNLHGSIDEAVDRNLLTPEQAAVTKKAAALRLTAATYRKMAQEDPARAVAELTADDSPHPLVPFLPDDIRAGLVAQAQLNIRARAIDEERNAFIADQERRRAVAETRDNYVKRALAGEPGLAVRLVNDDTLADDDKQRLLDTAARSTAADPPPAISNAATLELLDRIRRDDGDPERLVDPDALLDAYNRKELRAGDYQFLGKQFEDAQKPEGALLAAQARAFMRTFKPLVDPERSDAETAAAEQTLLVERALAAGMERMRAEGKDPGDLFDPSKPEYVASPFELVPGLLPRGAPAVPQPKPAGAQLAPATAPSRVRSPVDEASPIAGGTTPTPLSSETTIADPGSVADRPPANDSIDPFERAAQVTRRSVLERHQGVGTKVFNELMSAYPKAWAAWLEKGNEVFAPPDFPANPDVWTEEDEFKRQERERKKIEFAADTALLLLAPFRTEGTFGVGPRRPPPLKRGGPKPVVEPDDPVNPDVRLGGAQSPSTRLTPRGRKELGDIVNLADMTVADAIRARGGGRTQIKVLETGIEQQWVADVANRAAQGDREANRAIKMIKAADEKAQRKY